MIKTKSKTKSKYAFKINTGMIQEKNLCFYRS